MSKLKESRSAYHCVDADRENDAIFGFCALIIKLCIGEGSVRFPVRLRRTFLPGQYSALVRNRKGGKMLVNYNFEWNPIKARENWNKHNVAFDEAATIFRDSKALSIFDPDHSETEDRWITMSSQGPFK